MSELKEKAAYLQGLAEGLNIDKDSKEGKLFIAILDMLEEIVEAIDELAEIQEEQGDYLEAIDEDLGDLENEIYGDDDSLDEYDDEKSEEWSEDGDYVEMECPKCHDIVRFEESILSDDDVIEVTCPNCDQVVYVNDDRLQMEDEGSNNS